MCFTWNNRKFYPVILTGVRAARTRPRSARTSGPRSPWRWRSAKARSPVATRGGASGAEGGGGRRLRSLTERSEHPWERSGAEGSGGPKQPPALGGVAERRVAKGLRAVGRSLRQGRRGPEGRNYIQKLFKVRLFRLASLGVMSA